MRYLVPLLLGLCMLAPAQQPAKPDCKGMMAKMQQHRTAMKQMDEKLQDGLAKMNKAGGAAKVDAMAEVVTMLAQQRIQVHERMMSMNDDRSQHMMGHMQQGEKGKKAMIDCPMMQKETSKKSQED